jgi:hypothetical protein
MKIFKVFELRGNEVKEKLTQDDIDNIMDVFTGYVLDKYQMKEIHTIPRILGDDMDTSLGYYSCKISYDGLFLIDIVKSNKWSQIEFNQTISMVKKRLNSLGFITSGHSINMQGWIDYNNDRHPSSGYKIEIYKPMFATKKRIK